MFEKISNDGIKYTFPETIGQYKLIHNVSQGATGEVYLAKHIHIHQYVALKIVIRKDLDNDCGFIHFEHETRIHKYLNHQNIVLMKEVLYFQDYIVMVLEYCENGDLFNVIVGKCIRSTNKLLSMMYQMIDGLNYLHNKNIVHRDLKPDNIFLDKDFNIKIGDFGCSEECDGSRTNYDLCGTLFYTAPEILLNSWSDLKKYDIWSLGIVFYTMMTGKLPWNPGNLEDIKIQIINWDNSTIVELNDLFAIVRLCLSPDPLNRPTSGQLLEMEIFSVERRLHQSKNNLSISSKNVTRSTLSQSNLSVSSYNIFKPSARKRRRSCQISLPQISVTNSFLSDAS
ncbi:CAMK family protein kinase [Tritrichomonas foetus]|uniref:CAMK family protein kinase n=1 Tax=Tritrichomonas foetus TaxID=1144522 RepID=A0A1J4JSL6_9EUKA|nr:CAMK family protein kinase [Tritrichomonas foetus]|eukprot:OHT02097.1 CAMK family protein kinase [Tritrichomonas foetus]